MKVKGRISNFVVKIVLLLSSIKAAQTFLEADYYIQSLEQPLLCVEGTVPDENLDQRESATLFHSGKLVTAHCTNVSEQQWHFQTLNTNSTNATCLYNITSSAIETVFLKTLYANITGFFMKYWPNPMEVILLDKNPIAGNGSLVVLKEHSNNTCLQNIGKHEELKMITCKPHVTSQMWRLFLVTHGEVA